MSTEEIVGQISDLVFAGQACLSEVNAVVNADEGENKLGVDNQVCNSSSV